MKRESKVVDLRPDTNAGNGIHLLGEWYGCVGHHDLLEDSGKLCRLCLYAAKEAGLNVVGQHFHDFGLTGVIGTVVLEDSHLAIHTRPDERSVMLDVYISRHTPGNRAKAHAFYMFLRDGLLPGKENLLQINRGGLVDAVKLSH